jgi:GT2 family glycosyltransferase
MTLTPPWIVTLNWNLREDTIACVESVLDAGVALSRVIVVDNGSTDGSPRAFAAHFGPELPLICNESNLGFAGGMNAGIRYALEHGAGSVLLLNNDTLVAPTMIEALIDAEIPPLPDSEDAALRRRTSVRAQDAVGILGPAIHYHADPDRLWKLGDIEHRWLPMPLSVRPRGDRPLGWQGLVGTAPFQVDYVTGCCMLIRRQVFERIGLFDTRYFMYFEDADFCRRARYAGFTIWCVPEARMWHKVSLSAQRDRPLNRYHRALGQVRFYREHPHGPSAALRATYIAFKTAQTMLGDIWRRDWDLIAPLWRGTIDGYREGM